MHALEQPRLIISRTLITAWQSPTEVICCQQPLVVQHAEAVSCTLSGEVPHQRMCRALRAASRKATTHIMRWRCCRRAIMLRQMPFMPTCHRAALCHSCRLCLSLALCTMAREPRTCMPLVLVTVIKLCYRPGQKRCQLLCDQLDQDICSLTASSTHPPASFPQFDAVACIDPQRTILLYYLFLGPYPLPGPPDHAEKAAMVAEPCQ